MPELPEVEVVRRGLAPAVTGARVLAVEVCDARALKRHLPAGAEARSGVGVALPVTELVDRQNDFERRLLGARLAPPVRRGKFLWLPLVGRDEALLAHLGMSGQLLVRAVDAEDDRHVRIRLWVEHPTHRELRLDFADQRLFGSLAIDALAPDGSAVPGCSTQLTRPEAVSQPVDAAATRLLVPGQVAHIAPDPLEDEFDAAAVVQALRGRSRGVKHLLLDQTLLSGIGNIYADEALWAARVHPETPGSRVGEARLRALLGAVQEVFAKALAEGGTSFDVQYVNVNGEAGYFAHSLNAYGRRGEPCPRCGTSIKRVPFGGRSSHFCPRCQRKR